MPKAIDMVGRVYGRLKVLERSTKRNACGDIFWKCRCSCGNEVEVSGNCLRRGHTQSCGCYHKEKQHVKKHIFYGTRIYNIWALMIQRCENPKATGYSKYGGKGIKVCAEWHDAKTFCEWAIANGYVEPLTIDRIDSEKDYCPENCRFITLEENSRLGSLKWHESQKRCCSRHRNGWSS